MTAPLSDWLPWRRKFTYGTPHSDRVVMKGEHAYPATPHQRMIWSCRVLAQPAGYDFPFLAMEWPMEEAALEWENALIDMARELSIDFEDIDSIDLPPHFDSINKALQELSGKK